MRKPKTKRNVNLVSSHSDDNGVSDDGPGLACASDIEEPSAVSMLSGTTSYNPPHTLPFKLKPGETLVYYEEFIPDREDRE